MADPTDTAMVAMRDGVRLATDLFLPAGSGPWPAVLIRHPYAPNPFWDPIGSYIAEHGYVAVIQIVRGKHRSEGEPVPFVRDRADGYDTLDWIERQAWSDGRVAAFGDSYYGFTAWAAAASRHPALRALATRMTSSDIGDDWMRHGGVFNLGPIASWAAYTWTGHELCEFEPDWTVRPLADLVPSWTGGGTCRPLEEWLRRPANDLGWTVGIYGTSTSPALGLRLPALHRGAWWDPFRRGQMADWRDAAESSPCRQELVFDATDHYDHPWSPDGEPPIDILADLERFLPYLPRYLDDTLAFFDMHLRGRRPPGPPGRLVRYHLANGDWETSTTWPPRGTRQTELCLTAAGGLAAQPARGEERLAWKHDPADLVPSLTEYWAPLLELSDERGLAEREDVLTFTSEPLEAPLDLAGFASAELLARSSAPAMQLVVELVDVFPDGRCLRITEGVRQLPVDGDTRAAVDLGPVGYRLLPGHRLRLHVSSSSFPRYMPYPGDASDPWTATTWRTNSQELVVGGAAGSRLRWNRA